MELQNVGMRVWQLSIVAYKGLATYSTSGHLLENIQKIYDHKLNVLIKTIINIWIEHIALRDNGAGFSYMFSKHHSKCMLENKMREKHSGSACQCMIRCNYLCIERHHALVCANLHMYDTLTGVDCIYIRCQYTQFPSKWYLSYGHLIQPLVVQYAVAPKNVHNEHRTTYPTRLRKNHESEAKD